MIPTVMPYRVHRKTGWRRMLGRVVMCLMSRYALVSDRRIRVIAGPDKGMLPQRSRFNDPNGVAFHARARWAPT